MASIKQIYLNCYKSQRTLSLCLIVPPGLEEWKENFAESCSTLLSPILSWGVGVGDMTKIFYHGICNFISRLRYISRFIIRRVTRIGFLKKRTLQRWRNVSTDIYLLTLKNTKVQKQYCLNRLLA